MAFVRLTEEKNPKLAVDVDNALNYKNKEGEIKQREKKTALLDVIEEAGKTAGMNKGVVTLSVSTNGAYDTYFVNKDKETNAIVLRNAIEPKNEEKAITVKAIDKSTGNGYFYAIDTTKGAGKNLVDNIDVRTVERENGLNSGYLKASVRLKNDDLKKELEAKGEGHVAIVSKDGFKIVADKDLKNNAPEIESNSKKKFTPKVEKEKSDIGRER